MKEEIKKELRKTASDIGSEVVSKLILRGVAVLLITIFVGVGIYYIKNRTSKQIEKAVVEVKTLDAAEVGRRAGEVAKNFDSTRISFIRAYKKAKNDTVR
jgi:hypothetical protein